MSREKSSWRWTPGNALYLFLIVTPGARYRQRTRENVLDSEGTLILYFGQFNNDKISLTPNPSASLQLCPCPEGGGETPAIDADLLDPNTAVHRAFDFATTRAIATLNVAGPRLSGAPRAHEYGYACVTELIRLAR